jgi:hypothetical protein
LLKMSLAGKIGMAIGILGGLAGLTVAVIAAPLMGGIMAIIFIAVFGGVFIGIFKPMRDTSKLQKIGVSAQATVLKVWDTGVTVNNNPRIGMLLQVSPPNGMPYKVETKILISRLETANYQPGISIPVKIDLNNKNKVALDYTGGSSSGSLSQSYSNPSADQVKAVEEKLLKIDTANQQIIATGEEAKAIVLAYTPLGINVNGNNPAVTLQLEVMPLTRSPFKAEATGVIMETSIPKFQPGKEIFVKFDPSDTSKVSITHSE